jgi:hypothetical protein
MWWIICGFKINNDLFMKFIILEFKFFGFFFFFFFFFFFVIPIKHKLMTMYSYPYTKHIININGLKSCIYSIKLISITLVLF